MAKFILEKIDADNVKKTDTRPEITILNIPALNQQKAELEVMIAKMQNELAKINEVLDEYKKLP